MIRTGETDIVVERSGDFDEATFGIEAEDVALILELIRNKLYTNKLGSFVREIISNAYDSMVDADILGGGCGDIRGKKIKLILPNNDNHNTFTIRDYGTGMSDQKIKKIYTKVGKSTRSKSNKFVGMMGIGRLVGFCLTDSFNVISYVDGVRTEYLCYIDETKVGKVAMLSQTETTEANGVGIAVNVPENLHSKLAAELADFISYVDEVGFSFSIDNTAYYSPFKILHSVADRSTHIAFKGTNWVKYTDRMNSIPVYVKMGIVKYPVPESVAGGRFFSSGSIVYTIPIGDVSVSTSREALEMTGDTTAYLKKLFDGAKTETGAEMYAALAKVTDVKSALDLFGKFNNVWYSLGQPKFMFTDPTTKKEIDISQLQHRTFSMTTFTPVMKQVDVAGKLEEVPELDANGKPVLYEVKNGYNDYEVRVYKLDYNRRSKEDKNFGTDFGKSYYRIVAEHELESLPDIRRCRTIYTRSNFTKVYVFTQRGLDHFINMVGYNPTVYWEKFDDVVETILPRGSIARPPVRIRKIDIGTDPVTNKPLVVTINCTSDLDNIAPGYWVTRNYSKILYDRGDCTPIDENDLITIFKHISIFLKKNLTLYILPANEGRFLDKLRDEKSDDYADLVPCKVWVEHLFATTKLLEYLCEATTDITCYCGDITLAAKIFSSTYNVKAKETVDMIELIKKAIRPLVPGQTVVPNAVIENLRNCHRNDKLKISNYGSKLKEVMTTLHGQYSLLPDTIEDFRAIHRFVNQIAMYDEYVYAVQQYRNNTVVAIEQENS